VRLVSQSVNLSSTLPLNLGIMMLTSNITLTDSQFETLKRDIVCASLPFLSVEDYARITNDTTGNVRQQVHQGRLPIRKKQKSREKTFINMLAIRAEAELVV
jgi:hypothetical protein